MKVDVSDLRGIFAIPETVPDVVLAPMFSAVFTDFLDSMKAVADEEAATRRHNIPNWGYVDLGVVDVTAAGAGMNGWFTDCDEGFFVSEAVFSGGPLAALFRNFLEEVELGQVQEVARAVLMSRKLHLNGAMGTYYRLGGGNGSQNNR